MGVPGTICQSHQDHGYESLDVKVLHKSQTAFQIRSLTRRRRKMLHNKSTGLKPDVMSMESLVNWLEQQPAKAEYEYFDHRGCLVARYLNEHGYENVFAYSMGHFK